MIDNMLVIQNIRVIVCNQKFFLELWLRPSDPSTPIRIIVSSLSYSTEDTDKWITSHYQGNIDFIERILDKGEAHNYYCFAAELDEKAYRSILTYATRVSFKITNYDNPNDTKSYICTLNNGHLEEMNK